jgi:hypothetical protein
MIRDRDTIRFVHRNAYTPDQARNLFSKALRAGIRRLKSFRPAKKDAGGTRVVISLEEKRKEILIPYFSERQKGRTNHKRYLAVSEVLGNFDTDAFEGPGAKPKVKPAAVPAATPVAEPAATPAATIGSPPPVKPAATE